MLGKGSLIIKIASFPFKLMFRVLVFLIFIYVILYFINQIINGEAIIYPIIGLWLILAYLGLPYMHRKLTKIYLPNYYIGRTRTGDGFLGDPINLAFLGTKRDIMKSMEKAGWTLADELNHKSTISMIKNTLLRRSYPNAPVSSLYLFSDKQNFAYQIEVGGTTSRRHHIRFWKVPDGWFLPGGFKADWLAAATFDRKVGFSSFTLQITHKIESNIDTERDYVIQTIRKFRPSTKIKIIKKFASGYHDRNGGGDHITTDGSMPFIDLQN